MSEIEPDNVATQDLVLELKELQNQPDGPHPDFVMYVKIAEEQKGGTNLTGTLRLLYAQNGNVSEISEIGNPFEKELWNYGIERLREETGTTPEPGVVVDSINKELIEEIKEQK